MPDRGIDARLINAYVDAIEKEDKLKLKWFRKNEERLNAIANKPTTKAVPEEVKEKFKQDRIDAYTNAIKNPRVKTEDSPPRKVPGALQGVMRPVDPSVTRLIYTGLNKDGRLNYLTERMKMLPEDRYFFTECTSFEYGWKMWNHAKTVKKTGFGRQQVIKESFYRRRGVERDPDWYKEPAGYSPMVCTTT
ncbi:hypothetical protein NQ318_004263 [Aromia moschata]|uniref:Sperm microtubule inner protein 1 C-terminal domain-containing protein n=1 Tax=Aromia moschata TaxID=1265417 RepID=A0AAV8XSD4_9CUCU|nr:hypothetical protein NQ318_004263 [Aromia moschata]